MNRRARLERWLREVWDGRRPVAAMLLSPLSLFWRFGSWWDRTRHQLGIRHVTRLDVPVIAVGNLTVGGAGKTPVALALAQRLLAAGRKVAVVSRGYGAPGIGNTNRRPESTSVGTLAAVISSALLTAFILSTVQIESDSLKDTVAGILTFQVAVVLWLFFKGRREVRGPSVVTIVSDGNAVRANANEGGDEPVWLARRDPRLIVVAAEKRAAAAATALELGADVIILDDGLSHYALHHDAEVLVVDDLRRFGNGRLLPAGPMRLPPERGRSADLVWYTRAGAAQKMVPLELHDRPSIRTRYEPVRLVDLDLQPREELETVRGRRAMAVCGIAGPEAFVETVKSLGVDLRTFLEYPDHHAFTQEDAVDIAKTALAWQCDLVLTTEKDAVRLALVASGDLYRAIAMDVVMHETKALDSFVRRFAIAAPEAA